nr:nuclease-related domain-containing protein [Bacillus oleivorans]
MKNPKTQSGYSQIDHVVLTPFGIFVIETKTIKELFMAGNIEKHGRSMVNLK